MALDCGVLRWRGVARFRLDGGDAGGLWYSSGVGCCWGGGISLLRRSLVTDEADGEMGLKPGVKCMHMFGGVNVADGPEKLKVFVAGGDPTPKKEGIAPMLPMPIVMGLNAVSREDPPGLSLCIEPLCGRVAFGSARGWRAGKDGDCWSGPPKAMPLFSW